MKNKKNLLPYFSGGLSGIITLALFLFADIFDVNLGAKIGIVIGCSIAIFIIFLLIKYWIYKLKVKHEAKLKYKAAEKLKKQKKIKEIGKEDG